MSLNINNSKAPARLSAAKLSAAKGAANYGAACHYADWRNVRTKKAALFGGPVWSHHKRAYVATEAAAVAGLREVGYTDAILTRTKHKGWFADSWQDETYRGQVWQLPARNGKTIFIYGYVEPNSETIILAASNGQIETADNKEDAARWADSLAEKMAEWSRESQDAAQSEETAHNELNEYRQDFAQIARGYREQLALGLSKYSCGMYESKLEEKREGFKKSLAELIAAKARALFVEKCYSVD